MKKIVLVALTALMFSCNNSDDTPDVRNPSAPGLAYALSEKDFNTTYNSLRSAVQSNSEIKFIEEIDHKANAQSVNKDLRNTKLIIFGNPKLGTALLKKNQLAGLDLPQKLLVFQDGDNNVFVSFNSTSYLAARHNVGGANTIQQINSALTGLAVNATGGIVAENATAGITSSEGIISIKSNNDFITTYFNLRNAIADKSELKLISQIDHQANAQSVGETLDPTRLIIFGNTKLGTPLIQSSQTAGIDLPQKMLVWEDASGDTFISYNRPEFIKSRHGINGNDDVIANIGNTLSSLAVSAAN